MTANTAHHRPAARRGAARLPTRLGRSAGILAVAAIMAGCSFSASIGGKSLDQEDVEEKILTGLAEDVGVEPKAIDCEGIADIDVEKGNTFTCTGTAPNDDEFDVDVTLTDDDGAFSAVVPS